MKNTKYQLQNFFLFDYTGVEKHLDEMSRKGWRLEKTGTMFWKYKKIEPAELTHSVTYVNNASDFNPQPTKEQMQLNEYCECAGWKRLCDWNKMNIYYTESKNPVPLDTEEEIRFENIKKSVNKQFVLSNGLLLGLFILYTLFQGFLLFGKDSGVDLSRGFDRFTMAAFIFCLWGVFMASGSLLLWYHWLKKSKESVAGGGACFTTPFYLKYNQACFIITITLLVLYVLVLVSGSYSSHIITFVLCFVGFFLIMNGVKLTQRTLKKRKVSRKANIVFTLIVDVVLAFILVGFINFIVFKVLI